MSRLRLLLMVVVIALGTSSCMYIEAVIVSDVDVSVGETTTVKVKLKPATNGLALTFYPFVMIGYPDQLVRDNVKKFDPSGVYGGPYVGVRDFDIRTAALALCNDDMIDLGGFAGDWQVYRTPEPITTAADTALVFRHTLTVDNNDAALLSTGFIVVSGFWADDDANGVIDDGELGCQGLSVVPLTINS